MRVAWLSHQFAADTPQPARPGLLPGLYAGGAERSTEEMIAAAPQDVEVVRFRLPSGFGDLSKFDRVVVGATEALSPLAQKMLLKYRPIVWVRSPQESWRMELMIAARKIVWPSHECARWHGWFTLPYEICPAPLDVSQVPQGQVKENYALWAGRNHPQKGEREARRWAEERDIPFVGLTNAPREQVLEAMGRARWFVHLPQHIIDPCPRTVIEAEIAGCEIVTNELCGRVPVRGAQAVAEFVSGVANKFWGWVRDS
jgi:hypothetical protein